MSPLKEPGHGMNILSKKCKYKDFTCFLRKHLVILKILLTTASEFYLGIPYLSLVDFSLVFTPPTVDAGKIREYLHLTGVYRNYFHDQRRLPEQFSGVTSGFLYASSLKRGF
jgi:hypothetical protein